MLLFPEFQAVPDFKHNILRYCVLKWSTQVQALPVSFRHEKCRISVGVRSREMLAGTLTLTWHPQWPAPQKHLTSQNWQNLLITHYSNTSCATPTMSCTTSSLTARTCI